MKAKFKKEYNYTPNGKYIGYHTKHQFDKAEFKRPPGWPNVENYSITTEEYDQMLKKQNYCCNICKTHQSMFRTKLFVDRCHSTGKIRGLLCRKCNTMLCSAHDNIDILVEGVRYLKKQKVI